jgi:plasmid stability protein
MKTTLDLPDDLVKQLKLRAVHEGKKLKDAVAETLRAGLAAGGLARPRPSGASATGRLSAKTVRPASP